MYPLMNSHQVLGENGLVGLSLKIVIVSLSSLSSKVEVGVKSEIISVRVSVLL